MLAPTDIELVRIKWAKARLFIQFYKHTLIGMLALRIVEWLNTKLTKKPD